MRKMENNENIENDPENVKMSQSLSEEIKKIKIRKGITNGKKNEK